MTWTPRFARSRAYCGPVDWRTFPEPVYAGDFNDILRPFNDEKRSVKLRFRPPCVPVESGLFEICSRRSISSTRRDRGLAGIRAPHHRHHPIPEFDIDDALYRQ